MSFSPINEVIASDNLGPLVYEVKCWVNQSVEQKWLLYMKGKHIEDVLATGLFKPANLLKLEKSFQAKEHNKSQWEAYVVQYSYEGQESFEKYQNNFAEGLQKEHKDIFGNSVRASRAFFNRMANP